MVALLREVGKLVTQDMEKTEALAFFASFSLVRFSLRTPTSPSLLTVHGSKAVEESGVTDHLSQLATHKSTGLVGLH